MRNRAYIVGIVAAGLMATAAHTAPSYCRWLASAHSFRETFQTLDRTRTALNPVERFLFSLMLANTKTQPEEKGAAALDRRTT
jgi:hypothetical protein